MKVVLSDSEVPNYPLLFDNITQILLITEKL